METCDNCLYSENNCHDKCFQKQYWEPKGNQTENKIKVLSLFDGMSCGQIAFERAGISVEKYYASEIDKYAIQVTMTNYPGTIQLGDIKKWKEWNIEKPDIIIGGSPCQGFSFAGKQLNFEDERSKLFFTFIDILKHYKPKYFLLENVKMKKEYRDVISGSLGIEPMIINSALVSAQNRRRLYWTNIPGVKQPEDKGILLKDIIENGEVEKCHTLSNTALNRIDRKNGYKPQIMPEKTGTLNTKNNSGQLSIDNGTTLIPIADNLSWRKLTPIECERLQTVPDNFTAHVSNSQRYKMLGNGWTVDVIAHVFSNIKEHLTK